MSDDVMLTAAIDFGTMYSGYSSSLKSHPDDIRLNTQWTKKEVNRTVFKAPTCLLLKQETDGNNEEKIELLAFGFEAQEMYKGHNEEENKNEYYYEEFKMALYLDKELGKPNYKKMIKALGKEKECDAETIFTLTLRFLKDKLLNDINSQVENKLEAKNIQWVLTVPAIWSDVAKRFMRKCAELAGIVDDEDSERLLVSLEPECAAMYCRVLKGGDIIKGVEDFSGIPDNTKYMVVDCGGGTVDITAQQLKKEDDICELFARSSKNWGGRNIDRIFEDKLENVMGKDLYDKFSKTLTPKFLDLKIRFEESKRSIKFDDESYSLNLDLPYEFFTLCKEVTEKEFKEHIKISSDKNVSLRSTLLSFNSIAINQMFQPVVDRICNHVIQLLQEPRAKGMQYVFFVGGFSDCGSIQLTMTRLIEDETKKTDDETLKNVKIVTPRDAVLTIMKGAVKFGYNPQAISSRRSRYTYGTCVHEKYDPKKHDPEYRVIGKDGQLYCSNIFYPLLGKDQEILQDDVLDFVFQPLWNEQDEVEFYLYSINEYIEDVKYVTDSKMKRQPITVKLDKGADYSEKPIRLLLYFGSTELHVQVVDDNNPHKKKGEASLDLLDV